jgi:DNA-binding NarL/FixJ family response regulator
VAGARLLAERNPTVTSLVAAALHAEGLNTNDLAVLHRAVEAFRGSPRPLDRVAALEDTGYAELATGNTGPAVALLRQAVEEATSCGARRAVARIRRRLHALGVPGGAGEAKATGTPKDPLSSLTPSERNIARMITEGLSNRQIAERIGRSPHTVDSHIRNIFNKLGVNSRVALTRLIAGMA